MSKPDSKPFRVRANLLARTVFVRKGPTIDSDSEDQLTISSPALAWNPFKLDDRVELALRRLRIPPLETAIQLSILVLCHFVLFNRLIGYPINCSRCVFDGISSPNSLPASIPMSEASKPHDQHRPATGLGLRHLRHLTSVINL